MSTAHGSPDVMQSFLDMIKARLEAGDVTLTLLARDVGISRPYLYRVLRGEQIPTLTVANRIASSLGLVVAIHPRLSNEADKAMRAATKPLNGHAKAKQVEQPPMISDDDAKRRVCENLCRIMDEKQISQAELARLTGEHDSRIARYRLGKSIPSLAVAARLCTALDSKVSDLLE